MSEKYNDNSIKKDNQIDHAESEQNLYKNQYEQQQLANLEENAPQLNSPMDMAVNKKAVIFIILAGFGMTALGAFAYHHISEPEEVQQPTRAEVVNVPDLPPPEPHQVIDNQNIIPLSDEKNNSSNVDNKTNMPEIPTPTINQETPQPQIQMQVPIESQIPGGGIPSADNSESFVQGGDLENTTSTTPIQVNAIRYMHNRDKLLLQGTYLRCVLETKIVSEVAGFTSCLITEPVYSSSGKYMLLPQGSKVMGQYGSSNPTGNRLAVIWDRIITPDGIDVTLKSPGVDNLGAAGHTGKFKSHWPSRLGSALLISMISDTFKYAASEYGPEGKTVTTSTSTIKNPYESESAETLKRLAIQQLERNNARPNTVTINQGNVINIYTAQDIDFSSVIQ